MGKHTLEVDLMDKKSIKQFIKDLKAYKKDIKNKVAELSYRLAQQGYKEVEINIHSYDIIDTGELLNSLTIDGKSRWANHKSVYYVRCESDYAVFVEFGTGYIGKDNPYPYDFPMRWNYCSGKMLKKYAKKGMQGWVYPADDGQYVWTEGQRSRPFMSDAFRALTEEVEWIAEEVFK